MDYTALQQGKPFGRPKFPVTESFREAYQEW